MNCNLCGMPLPTLTDALMPVQCGDFWGCWQRYMARIDRADAARKEGR